MHRRVARTAIIAPVLFVTLGCMAETEPRGEIRTNLGKETLEDTDAEPPDFFTNAKGVVFVPFDREAYDFKLRDVPVEDLTENELAEAFRAVTVFRGREYIQEGPATDVARAIKNDTGPQEGEGFIGLAENGDEQSTGEAVRAKSQNIVSGTDDRATKTEVWPYRTHIAISGTSTFDNSGQDCSATLVAESTAVGLASCFHEGFDGDWYPTKSWAPGADDDSGTAFPYGAWTGCYQAFIPSAFVTTESPQSFLLYDVAAIEFNGQGGCGLTPGNTVGWLGWRLAGDSEIEDNSVHIGGYPESKPDWPSLYDMSTGNFFVQGPGAPFNYALSHLGDQTNGQEGVGLYMDYDPPGSAGQGLYVVGIQSFAAVNGYNLARRFDSGVRDFLEANTNF